MTLTPPTPATAGHNHLLQYFFFSITHPREMNPVCSQSNWNRIARRRVMGAWMKRASIGLFRVEGYWCSVTWIDRLVVSFTIQEELERTYTLMTLMRMTISAPMKNWRLCSSAHSLRGECVRTKQTAQAAINQFAIANLSPTPFTSVSLVTSFLTSNNVRQNPTTLSACPSKEK
jgi:hypothetical protein